MRGARGTRPRWAHAAPPPAAARAVSLGSARERAACEAVCACVRVRSVCVTVISVRTKSREALTYLLTYLGLILTLNLAEGRVFSGTH